MRTGVDNTAVCHAQDVNTNAVTHDRLPTNPRHIRARLNLKDGHWQWLTAVATLLLLSSVLLVLLLARRGSNHAAVDLQVNHEPGP